MDRRSGSGRWLAAFAGWASCAAFAQEAPAPLPTIPVRPVAEVPAPGAPAEDPGRELPTIYVTAQKVRESLEDVPSSVTTIDSQLMRDTGSTGFEQMQNYAANMQLRLTPATSNFYIRGFGTDSSNAGFEPSVASVVDGIYYGRSNFLSMFFNDLDRMEVLRGPQGTLFGKNSSAGVLNITTMAPQPEFGSTVEMLVDTSARREFKPVLNAPLSDTVAIRLSGALTDDRGMLKNTDLDRHEGGPEQQTIRGRLRWTPSDDQTLDLGAFYSHQEYNNDLFQLSRVGPNMLGLMRTFDPDVETSVDNFRGSGNVDGKGIVDYSGGNVTFEQGLDGFLGFPTLAFTTITGYSEAMVKRRDFDADFSPVPVVKDSLADPSPYRQVSQELRFSGTSDDFFGLGGAFKFTVGGYYFRSTLYASDIFALQDLGATAAYLVAASLDRRGNGLVTGLGPLLGGAAGPITNIADLIQPVLDVAIGPDQSALVKLHQETEANASFGQAEWFIWRDIALIGGLRVGEEKKKAHASSFSDSRLLPLIAKQKNHDTRLHRTEHEVSPKAGLKWQPSRAMDVYLTWSQGYKSGGYNALPINPDNLEFGPEKATSVEAGIKARFLGGALSVAGTVFDTRFKDLQVSTFRDGGFIILNAAKARSRGVELDLNWLPPISGTSISESFGFVDAKYLSYPDAPAPAESNERPPQQSLTGKRLAITPRFSSTLIPSYTVSTPQIRGSTIFAVDYVYKSSRYLDVDLDPNTLQPATHEINARVTFTDDAQSWRVTVGAKNLTNETVLDQILDEPLAPGNFEAIRGDRGRYYTLVVTLALTD